MSKRLFSSSEELHSQDVLRGLGRVAIAGSPELACNCTVFCFQNITLNHNIRQYYFFLRYLYISYISYIIYIIYGFTCYLDLDLDLLLVAVLGGPISLLGRQHRVPYSADGAQCPAIGTLRHSGISAQQLHSPGPLRSEPFTSLFSSLKAL